MPSRWTATYLDLHQIKPVDFELYFRCTVNCQTLIQECRLVPLPETPQDYYAYFHRQRLSAQPPSEKWAIGEQAAQLWIDYHDQPNAGLDTLITFVRILMPYRYAGSGFYDL